MIADDFAELDQIFDRALRLRGAEDEMLDKARAVAKRINDSVHEVLDISKGRQPMPTLFQAGDRVRLKGSDESELIVEGYDDSGKVICSFWRGIQRDEGVFAEEALEKTPNQFPPH